MKFKEFLIEKSQEDAQDELENLTSVLRQMARKQGFYSFNTSIGDDHILIEVTMNKEETFHKIFQLLSFMRKIQKDYLTGFKCDMDLWETKKGLPLFTFEFYQTGSISSTPTYDYDDELPF